MGPNGVESTASKLRQLKTAVVIHCNNVRLKIMNEQFSWIKFFENTFKTTLQF